jgi:hypothetical protein
MYVCRVLRQNVNFQITDCLNVNGHIVDSQNVDFQIVDRQNVDFQIVDRQNVDCQNVTNKMPASCTLLYPLCMYPNQTSLGITEHLRRAPGPAGAVRNGPNKTTLSDIFSTFWNSVTWFSTS